MFDFRLDDDGQIELANIGEATTHDHLMRTCYAELEKTQRTPRRSSYRKGSERERLE
jgi:hypothetical protein